MSSWVGCSDLNGRSIVTSTVVPSQDKSTGEDYAGVLRCPAADGPRATSRPNSGVDADSVRLAGRPPRMSLDHGARTTLLKLAEDQHERMKRGIGRPRRDPTATEHLPASAAEPMAACVPRSVEKAKVGRSWRREPTPHNRSLHWTLTYPSTPDRGETFAMVPSFLAGMSGCAPTSRALRSHRPDQRNAGYSGIPAASGHRRPMAVASPSASSARAGSLSLCSATLSSRA